MGCHSVDCRERASLTRKTSCLDALALQCTTLYSRCCQLSGCRVDEAATHNLEEGSVFIGHLEQFINVTSKIGGTVQYGTIQARQATVPSNNER